MMFIAVTESNPSPLFNELKQGFKVYIVICARLLFENVKYEYS